MSRIRGVFRALAKERASAFVPYLTFGDPNPAASLDLLHELDRAGADVIELGIPFSDPMADGPVLQRASERALGAGATLAGALATVAEFRQRSETPIVLFGYANPLHCYGFERVARDGAEAGVDGFLCVDLPPDEGSELERPSRQHGIDLIYLLAPTSTLARVRTVLRKARGFVYFVSVAGVTGMRSSLSAELEPLVGSVSRLTDLPVGVGFGISTPEQAGEVAKFADAVIVGSAIAKRIEEARTARSAIRRVGTFAREMFEAVRTARER